MLLIKDRKRMNNGVAIRTMFESNLFKICLNFIFEILYAVNINVNIVRKTVRRDSLVRNATGKYLKSLPLYDLPSR
jgi:hypothetical protein